MANQANIDQNDDTKLFGVEFEFTRISKYEVAEILSKYFNDFEHSIYFDDSGEIVYEIKDDKCRYWQIKTDSSINALSSDDYPTDSTAYCVELATPKLNINDINLLKDIIKTIKANGAITNKSCGIHVNIDAKNHTPDTLCELIKIVYSKQNQLFKVLGVHRSRIFFCKKIRKEIITSLDNLKPITLSGILNVLYKNRKYPYEALKNCSINISNILQHKRNAIEFRFFNGSLDSEIIEAYIKLSFALSKTAINNVKNNNRTYLSKKDCGLSTFKSLDNKIIQTSSSLSERDLHPWFKELELDDKTISQLYSNHTLRKSKNTPTLDL